MFLPLILQSTGHPNSVAGIQKGIPREKYKKLKIDKPNRSK